RRRGEGNMRSDSCQTFDRMELRDRHPIPGTFMIRFLSVSNLAVIDRLELEFAAGLTVLTGETGAGKSILVGAVGLLVGGRASAELVRTGAETAAVQAVFEKPDGGEGIVRREVSS